MNLGFVPSSCVELRSWTLKPVKSQHERFWSTSVDIQRRDKCHVTMRPRRLLDVAETRLLATSSTAYAIAEVLLPHPAAAEAWLALLRDPIVRHSLGWTGAAD
jgi:hypothetical protein